MGLLARLMRLINGLFSGVVSDVEKQNPGLLLQELQDRLREAQTRFNTTTARVLAREKVARKRHDDERAKLQEVRQLIEEARRQNDRELALQLLIQEDQQAALVETSAQTWATIRDEAMAARRDFDDFQSDVYQQMRRIETLKHQTHLKALKDQMNVLRSQYQLEGGAGSIKADLQQVEDAVSEGLAEADAVAELGAGDINRRVRRLRGDVARSRAEERLKQLFGEPGSAPDRAETAPAGSGDVATGEGGGRALREQSPES